MFFQLDSGLNVDMPPPLELSDRKSISKKCTFRNKSQLQATVSGVVKIIVKEKHKVVEVTRLSCGYPECHAVY